MLIIFFDIKWIVHNEFILANQTVNSTYYCVHENVQILHPELWGQKNWLVHHDNAQFHTALFTGEF
jgi:hypothetical protein